MVTAAAVAVDTEAGVIAMVAGIIMEEVETVMEIVVPTITLLVEILHVTNVDAADTCNVIAQRAVAVVVVQMTHNATIAVRRDIYLAIVLRVVQEVVVVDHQLPAIRVVRVDISLETAPRRSKKFLLSTSSVRKFCYAELE